MEGVTIFVVVLTVALVIRIAAYFFDVERIRAYIMQQGGRVESIQWAPFGPGWLGEKNDRIYLVEFADAEGERRSAHCKTSMWSGVYFREEYSYASRADVRTIAQSRILAQENARLRDEVERLRRERAGG